MMKIKIRQAIYGISLGPGDADLITLKAYKKLKEIDVIYYPGSIDKYGSENSFSKQILNDLDIEKPDMKGIFISMNMDRKETENLYSEIYKQITHDYQDGKKIAIVSEGDISFFSTFSYFINRFKESEIDFCMIPGVPAFLLASSQAKIPLTFQNDQLTIVAAPKKIDDVLKALDYSDSVVVMKLTTLGNDLNKLLIQLEGRFVYCEQLGTSNEFVSTKIEEIKNRKKTYFSLLIINRYIKNGRR